MRVRKERRARRFALVGAGVALAMLLSGHLRAQAPVVTPPAARDPHTAQPERPTVATHAGTVANGYLEFESGIEFDRGPGSARNTLGNTLVKLGIGTRTQLFAFASASMPDRADGGLGDASIGLKVRLADKHELLGDFAVQGGVKFPSGSVRRGTGTGTTDASVLLISSRDIGAVHVDLNVGYTARDGDGSQAPRGQWLWTASFGGAFSPTVGWTVEVYGYPGTGGAFRVAPSVWLLYGPTFTVRNWLVLDVGAITPVSAPQLHALYAGATYNVGRIF
jgi:hypothetical protein